MKLERLSGWMPIRVYWQESGPFLDWCYLGEHRFTDPFFEQTVGAALKHPFNLVFRQQTPIEVLDQLMSERPGLAPSGLVFHMSRCGSTLVSQMLAALPQNIVISEAAPIDLIIRAHLKEKSVTDEQRIGWLRGIVNALGQPRSSRERHLFIKLDSWHTLDLSLIRRAFPETPWIFLYRRPVEVIVSQMKHRGAQMLPGIIEPSLLGLEREEASRMRPEEYCARVLKSFCRAAIDAYRSDGRAMLVNYSQLPAAVCTELPRFFGLSYTADELEGMARAAEFDAKSPSKQFADDTEAKNRAATEEMRRLAEEIPGPLYEQLETMRQSEEALRETMRAAPGDQV